MCGISSEKKTVFMVNAAVTGSVPVTWRYGDSAYLRLIWWVRIVVVFDSWSDIKKNPEITPVEFSGIEMNVKTQCLRFDFGFQRNV